MALYTAYFSYYTILNHYSFHTYAYDLGIYMQSLWTTLHGDGLFYTALWEGSRWGSHFEPIMLFILPLYAIFPRAETLLILQSLVLALGALPIYWIARDELGGKAGVAFAALYLLYPALHGVNHFDFHGSALAITPLLFSFYMFRNKRYKWGMALAVLAMMCKENVPLVVIFMGLYWLWEERESVKSCLRRKSFPKEREIIFPSLLILGGIVWFLVAVLVIIPYFSPEGSFVYSQRYETPLHSLFVDADMKVLYLFYLLAPLCFTSLLHHVVLIGLPILAQNLFASGSGMYVITNQHSSILIPWLFIASIYGVKWLVVKRRVIYARLPYVLLPVLLIAVLLLSYSPISLIHDMPQVTPHDEALDQVIELIPENASIYTQNDIFPHVCHRLHAYSTLTTERTNFFEYYQFPVSQEGKLYHWKYSGSYDYILVDSTTRFSAFKQADEESLNRLMREYGIYAQGDGIYLYKRGYEGEPLVIL